MQSSHAQSPLEELNIFLLSIFEQIIDYHANDPHVLMACSLTCQALIPMARKHLFHSVELKTAHNCKWFLGILDGSNAACTKITAYIRHLSLSPSRIWSTLWTKEWLPRILPQLIWVESLKIQAVRWKELSVQMQTCILSMDIHTLDMYVLFIQPSELFCMLSAFLHLGSLLVSYVNISQDPNDAAKFPFEAMEGVEKDPLTELVIDCDGMSGDYNYSVMRWIEHFGLKLDMRQLVFCDSVYTLQEELKVHHEVEQHASPSRSISGNPQSLFLRSTASITLVSSFISKYLSQVGPGKLRELRIETCLQCVNGGLKVAGSIDWKALDDSLVAARHACPELAVVFSFPQRIAKSPSQFLVVAQVIAEHLPGIRNCGTRLGWACEPPHLRAAWALEGQVT
ncbi:uncharacterized protein LAESUDRAFT_713307 [Laetiporus sulphureus 93-53]|uniref:F-box domain-containing protein n=1 Tax=Laetiporus sulphureus 93-53 TaxID=1314785 RepID=A0A165EZG5_9APHY|nr:uncharacterized protein LAESUDRAFT_713307 [Laetiporus sulphureus 93-53]KZT08043.1 hypothetical protein LAESUDRAFT_713307 [Laetiporus sulphureus 93-53]